MDFQRDQIFQLSALIWEAVLGITIEPDTGGAASRQRATAACVQLTGAWNGAILLDCPGEVARAAASIMFGTTPEGATLSEVQDAVAELSNMLGGNIKALLPETCYLSLPAVVEGGDYSARVPGSRLVERVSFLSGGQPVSVCVLEKVDGKAAAA